MIFNKEIPAAFMASNSKRSPKFPKVIRAAGISLLKIMRPLIIFICFICCVSFYFQNVIGPKAQTKLWTLLISMKQKSPEVDIPEGVFYDEIDGYNLYVKHKNRKTGMLYDVLIYNFEKGFENAQIIKSDSGRLEMTADKQHLYLHAFRGMSHAGKAHSAKSMQSLSSIRILIWWMQVS